MQKKDDSVLSNLSIDDLLESLTTEYEDKQGDSSPSKNWSMSEIDALLGIDSDEDNSFEAQPDNDKSDDFFQEKLDNIEEVVPLENNESSKLNTNIKNNSEITKPDFKSGSFSDDKTRVFNSTKEIEGAIAVFDHPKDIPLKKDVEVSTTDTSSLFENDLEKTTIVDINKNQEAFKKEDSNIIDFKENISPKNDKVSQKTLSDIHPIYNENIKHNIITKKIEKYSGRMESDKYRERFINPPVQNLEKTADYERLRIGMPEQKFERPGIIIKKGGFSCTADLEPIPTIISADDELKNVEKSEKTNKLKNSNTEKKDEIAGQIKLSGFEEHDEVEKIDEEVVEKHLKNSRKEKIKKFQLSADLEHIPDVELDEQFSEDELEKLDSSATHKTAPFSLSFIEDEYEKPEDKSRVLKKLSRATKFSLSFSIIELIILIASIAINSIVKISGGNYSAIGGSANTYIIINIILLLLACIFEISTFIKGIQGIFSLKPNAATGNVVVFLLCIIQCVVLLFTSQSSALDFAVYAPVACFIFTVSAFSRFVVLKRVLGNFEFCTGGTSLYSAEEIASEADAFEIGRGLLLGDPDIRYSSRINFPLGFIDKSFSKDPADTMSEKLVPSVLGAAFIVAIISGIISKDAMSAFSSFVAIGCIGIPAFSIFSSNLSLLIANKKLNSNGCAILGHDATLNSASANAIVVDSSDLFKKGRCGIDGIKTFHSMRIDEAILDAAALVIESGGPLSDVFDGVILGRREILPPVESLAYEDRLGLSAWIHGRRVLLGSRDLLINHNVEAPDIKIEEKYIKRGKNVMYLSVAGKVAAMFVISYYANESIGRSLRKIEERGLTILVRTSDCNITEELLCEYFNLPLSAVKIISPVSGDIFNKYRKSTLEGSSSGILHKGTEDSFLNSLAQAIRLNKLTSINTLVQIIYSSVAVAIFALLSFLSGLSNVGATQIIVFQLAWGAIASLIPVFKKS